MVIIGHSRQAYGSAVAVDPTRSREKASETVGEDGEDSARRQQLLRNTTQAHN
jgi:hypothetical protein